MCFNGLKGKELTNVKGSVDWEYKERVTFLPTFLI